MHSYRVFEHLTRSQRVLLGTRMILFSQPFLSEPDRRQWELWKEISGKTTDFFLAKLVLRYDKVGS